MAEGPRRDTQQLALPNQVRAPASAWLSGTSGVMAQAVNSYDRGSKISAGLLARNTLLNVVGQIAPALVALVTIPSIIRGLGTEGYGVFSLALIVLGYFGLFDLGLGRATTKFVAEYLGQDNAKQLPGLVWTSLGLQLLLGSLGGILLAAAAPLLVSKVLNIAPALVTEAETTFFFLAPSLPVVLGAATLQGVLAAGQRFDLVNAVNIPSSSLSFLIPAAALPLGFGLPGIVLLLLGAKLAAGLAYLVLCLRVFPSLKHAFSFDRKLLRPLFVFGGWVAVSNTLSPILTYLERFLIASLLSVGMLTFYAAPYEMVSRAVILPVALASTIFPAFSYYGPNDRLALKELFFRSLKWILFVMTPVAILFAVFAGEILLFWLGQNFAQRSTALFQILALTFFLHAFAHLPLAAIQGLGRPDLKAKLDLVQVPLFIGLLWGLIPTMGINGAALAKLIITVIDVTCLFGLAKRLVGFSIRRLLIEILGRGILVSIVFAAAAFALAIFSQSLPLDLSLLLVCVVVYVIIFWNTALDSSDRAALRVVWEHLFRKGASA